MIRMPVRFLLHAGEQRGNVAERPEDGRKEDRERSQHDERKFTVHQREEEQASDYLYPRPDEAADRHHAHMLDLRDVAGHARHQGACGITLRLRK